MTMHWKIRQPSLYDLQNVPSTTVLAFGRHVELKEYTIAVKLIDTTCTTASVHDCDHSANELRKPVEAGRVQMPKDRIHGIMMHGRVDDHRP